MAKRTRLMIGIPTALAALALLVWLGLPAALRGLGLHRHYEIPPIELSGHRALLVPPNHDTLGESGMATGAVGADVSVPYYAFLDAGLEVDIASPEGGRIPVEPNSMSWPLGTAADRRFKRDPFAMGQLDNSMRISEIDASAYDVVFLVGGWGAAYDLGQSPELGDFMTEANANGAVIGGVCHGPLGLLQARDTDGTPLVQGRRVTAVSDVQVEQLGIEITPMHPERELREMGALYEKETAFRDFFATHVVVDGNLVTGQNQNSGAETAHRMMEILAKR